MTESSRRLERSADLRSADPADLHPGGMREFTVKLWLGQTKAKTSAASQAPGSKDHATACGRIRRATSAGETQAQPANRAGNRSRAGQITHRRPQGKAARITRALKLEQMPPAGMGGRKKLARSVMFVASRSTRMPSPVEKPITASGSMCRWTGKKSWVGRGSCRAWAHANRRYLRGSAGVSPYRPEVHWQGYIAGAHGRLTDSTDRPTSTRRWSCPGIIQTHWPFLPAPRHRRRC